MASMEGLLYIRYCYCAWIVLAHPHKSPEYLALFAYTYSDEENKGRIELEINHSPRGD